MFVMAARAMPMARNDPSIFPKLDGGDVVK